MGTELRKLDPVDTSPSQVSGEESVARSFAYRLRVLDENLRAPHLVLVGVHVDRPQQVLDALAFVPPPPRPGLRGQDGVPVGEERGSVATWLE